jgi:hypothetical protein
MTSYQSTRTYRSKSSKPERESSAGLMVLALFLGIAVAILGMTAIFLLKAADDARDDASAAAATTDHSSHVAAASSAVSLPLQSFAGQTADNAEELALAHQARSAALPPVATGDLVKVHMTMKDMVAEIAPGVRTTPGHSTDTARRVRSSTSGTGRWCR